MTWTKREIIESAFVELGLGNHSMSAEQWQQAMYRLDNMMAIWSKFNIIFDPVYPQPATKTGGDLDDETNAPPEVQEAMFLNLALKIPSSFGKTPSNETKLNADMALKAVRGFYLPALEQSLQGMVRGAGSKYPESPFILAQTKDTTSIPS